MCTAHCKQHTTHSNYILKRCTLHYTLHNAYCTLKPYNTQNLTLPTANSSILLCRPPGKHTTVLEMEFCVVDFCLVTDTVYKGDYSDPESVLVLLTNDLVRGGGSQWLGLFRVGHIRSYLVKTASLQVAIDCKSTGLPSHENPYAMDFQVSDFSSRIRHVGF